jgi:DNA repair exonuclease SbcCD ATPase subunit
MNSNGTQRAQTFDETESTDDDYSIVDMEETGSESGEFDSELERSFMESGDDSIVFEAGEEETASSEVDQEEALSTTESDSRSPTPTPNTPETPMVVALADFNALQAQVSFLKEQLSSHRLAYETRFIDLKEAFNTMAEQLRNLLESSSIAQATPEGFSVQSHVEVLSSQTENNTQRISTLEEIFSKGQLEKLQEQDGILFGNFGHMKRILESLSVEHQRLKNNQMANRKTLEKLELQLLETQEPLRSNMSIVDSDKFRERFEKNEKEIHALRASCHGLLVQVHGSQSNFLKVDKEIERVTRHLEAVEQNQGDLERLKSADLDYDNVVKSVEQCNNTLNNATQSLKISLQEQRQILQRDIHMDNQKFESHLKDQTHVLNRRIDTEAKKLQTRSKELVQDLKDLEYRFKKSMEFESRMTQDLLIAKVDESEQNFTDCLAKLEQRLGLPEETEADTKGTLPQSDFNQLSTRLMICEKALAQLSRTSIDTIRACKPTVHDCSRVIPQVQVLQAWKRSVEQTGNMSKLCFHSNTAEERMEDWVKDYESKNEAWKKATHEGIKEWAMCFQTRCNEWAVKVEKKFPEMEARQEKEYNQRLTAYIEEKEKIAMETMDKLHNIESAITAKITQHVKQQFLCLLESWRPALGVDGNEYLS